MRQVLEGLDSLHSLGIVHRWDLGVGVQGDSQCIGGTVWGWVCFTPGAL